MTLSLKKTQFPKIADLEKELEIITSNTLAKSTKRPPGETAKALLSWKRSQNFYDDIVDQIGDLKGKKLLEIGCGYSLFLAICKKNGIDAVGIEPATQEFYQHTLKISKEILKRAGVNQNIVKQGVGENIPFKRNTFDAVVSLYTIEHVQNVDKVIKESLRVLKSRGYIYMIIPNYGSFWEGHYGILWIPYLPKSIAKLYVRLWCKDPKALEDYTFVNQIMLEKILSKLPIIVKSWGKNQFSEQVLNLKLSGGTLGSAKKIIDFIRGVGLLKVSVYLANLLKAQTPIILVGQKN